MNKKQLGVEQMIRNIGKHYDKYHPDPDQTEPCKYIEDVIDELRSFLATERQELEKAYGGCHKCYGKGYATVRRGETYRGSTHNKRTDIKYCTCERGKQLSELIQSLQDKEKQ